MSKSGGTTWWQLLGALVVGTLVTSLYFGDLLWAPASTVPAVAGDGLTIHYNLAYHAAYGSGTALTSQYHPYQESVFMTDAHALVAVVFAGLRVWCPGVEEYAIPTANLLIFWSIPLAALLLFLVLKQLSVNLLLALIFSVLIALMSPQIHRQMAGQYTLGFTWLLPLMVWYLLGWSRSSHYWRRSVLVGAAVYLLGLNNPYLYAVTAAFLLAGVAIGGLAWVVGKPLVGKQQMGHWLVLFVTTTLLLYFTLASADRVDDRVAVPFGFFNNTANWGGLLTSPGVLAYDWLRETFPGLARPRHENQLYLGLVPLVMLLVLPVVGMRRAWRERLAAPPALWLCLGAAALGLFFAFGLPFIFRKDWTYDHLGAVLQFRAPARFGWPFYYAAAITAAFLLARYYALARNRWLATGVVALAVLVWSVEVHQFLTNKLAGKFNDNLLAAERIDEVRQRATALGIDTSAYSSIFLLPTELGWTDKIHHNGTTSSNQAGYQLSLATGLPLLNGKLSRLSLSRSLQSLQLTSDPLIAKEIINQIDTTKDLLLLAVKDELLDPPELRLKRLGTALQTTNGVSWLRLSPTVLRREHELAVARALADTTVTNDYLYLDADEAGQPAYFGPASRLVPADWTDLLSLPVGSLPATGPWALSGWIFADGRRFGGPKLELRMVDAKGKITSVGKEWINTVYETHGGWQRFEFTVAPPVNTARVVLTANHDFAYRIDALLLRPASKNVRLEDGTEVLYNGFRLPN